MPNPYWLVEAARETGFPVIEVPGWQGRGHQAFPAGMPKLVVGHHTGTPTRAQGDYPSLGVVRDGRSDLPGPLCNYGLGRSGTIYVVAAGVAWHAGASKHLGYTSLNNKSIGIEAESAGGGVWTSAQLDCYPRLVGACLRRMGVGTDHYVSHRAAATPAGRKPDPKGIDDDWMRAKAAEWLARPSAPANQPAPAPVGPPASQEQLLRDIHAALLRPMEPWDGGTTGDPAVPAYNLIQYLLRDNVEQEQLRRKINSMSDVLDRIAKRLDDV